MRGTESPNINPILEPAVTFAGVTEPAFDHAFGPKRKSVDLMLSPLTGSKTLPDSSI